MIRLRYFLVLRVMKSTERESAPFVVNTHIVGLARTAVPAKVDKITSEVVRLLNDPALKGLATLRHYPMEKRIYARFGRCGFALDLLFDSGRETRHVSILVEAVASGSGRRGKRGFLKSQGTVTAHFVELVGNTRRYRTIRSAYRDADELFSQVEKVRAEFYRRYEEIRARVPEAVGRVEAEVFHSIGVREPDLFLGV
ncbi:MAG: hypothetical protein NZ988_01655 [Thaumarchaeota archaeon]|nr:hypothetical protein [Candidatus Calditenuaceae archaeon]MDW8186740.1 hypothetical protein [Nitrososphaerota archaeon]